VTYLSGTNNPTGHCTKSEGPSQAVFAENLETTDPRLVGRESRAWARLTGLLSTTDPADLTRALDRDSLFTP
jgi:hypothetical protein